MASSDKDQHAGYDAGMPPKRGCRSHAVCERASIHGLAAINTPVVVRCAASAWPCMAWSPAYFQEPGNPAGGCNARALFHDGTVSGSREPTGDSVVWENQCRRETTTLAHFSHWLDNRQLSTARWGYISYQRIRLFADTAPAILAMMRWGDLGVLEEHSQEAVFWYGSTGAHTQCHYDTYGTNVIVQVHGRKRWCLFSPNQTTCLYPTRVPYEESSVFSRVDVHQPDYERHPLFAQADCWEVILQPGDVLHVPRHWWHDVESLETSISVNVWQPHELDGRERVKEALVRLLATSMAASHERAMEILPSCPDLIDKHEVTRLPCLFLTLMSLTEPVEALLWFTGACMPQRKLGAT